MGKITIIAALLLFSFASNAQRFREIVTYEVETREGGKLFGISETKDKADAIMFSFQKRNAGTKYDITSHPAEYKFTTVPVENANDDPINKFKSKMGGKAYKVFSKQTVKDFEILKSKGISALVSHYLNSKEVSYEVTENSSQDKIENNLQNTNNKKYYKEVVLWEVETRIDGLLFGIAETKDSADAIMEDFQKRNANSKYDISRYPAKYKFTSLPVENANDNPVAIFRNHTKGKAYKVLSAEDLKGIEIAKRKGLKAGVDYYIDVRGADRDFVVNRLKDIITNFDEYRIQSSSYLASTAD